MKRIISAVLVLAMAFSMVACGSTPTPTPDSGNNQAVATPTPDAATPTPVGAKSVKVGVCIYKFDDNFMTLYRQEIEAYFKTKNTADVTYDVTVVDGKNDQAEQTNQINTFISQGVDVLIINLVQTSSAATVVDIVKAANIPTVLINREPEGGEMDMWEGKLCYVGADAKQSGTIQGQIVRDLADKGDVNGNGKVDYVMIMGDPENPDAKYRTEFSIKALTDANIEVNKLVEQAGMWDQPKGYEIAAAALTQYGNDIDVIFCNNDGMAMGAMQAIEEAGRKVGTDIYLVGVDAIPEAVTAIGEGRMTGTVLNDHTGQSHAAVDAAILAVNGQAMDQYYIVDYLPVK